ncbi:hypothetical protein CDD82_5852 [Ophiocordyceps australis]|uniref:Uncharacterized protein n=1 Tax=Ophiocordyceps australis TaxID=1399860 RepID=A0A2C5Y3J7_9HYPO|nr:hypothetical protein CDD82_5852 [Ophiocordyceps australis]
MSGDLDTRAHHVRPSRTKRWMSRAPRRPALPHPPPMAFYSKDQAKSYISLLKSKLFIKSKFVMETPQGLMKSLKATSHLNNPIYEPLKIGSHSLPHGHDSTSGSDQPKLTKTHQLQDAKSPDSQGLPAIVARAVDLRPYPFGLGAFGPFFNRKLAMRHYQDSQSPHSRASAELAARSVDLRFLNLDKTKPESKNQGNDPNYPAPDSHPHLVDEPIDRLSFEFNSYSPEDESELDKRDNKVKGPQP